MSLEHVSVPGQVDNPLNKKVDRRGFLKITAGVGAAAGLAAVGGIAIPMISSDGEGANPNPDTQHLSGGNGTPTPDADPTTIPGSSPTATETITPEPTKTPEKEPSTLREAANRAGIQVGADLALNTLDMYSSIMPKEFNLIDMYGPLRWSVTESEKGKPQYGNAETIYNFAKRNSMDTIGHGIIYTNDYPDWLKNGSFSSDELKDILRKHVMDEVGHFKGRINKWHVITEAHSHPFLNPRDVLLDTLGDEYVDVAYQAARDADSSATLIYNDYGNETSRGANTLLTKSIVDRLKPKGLIDGVGMQMTVMANNPPTKEDLIKTLQSYGIPIFISEMTVNLQGINGTREERFAKQAEIYRTVVQAALDSGVCKSISFFNIGDKNYWLQTATKNPNYSPQAEATIFDDDLKPKPAYYAVLDVLKSRPPKIA